MKVEIYTATNVKSPKQRSGKYAALVVCQTKKGPAEKCVVKEEENTTYHRASLLAILTGLQMLSRSCEVTVHTPDQFIVTMVEEGNVEKWKREEWRRSQDKSIRNKELWQQFLDEMEKHTLHLVHTKDGAYFERLEKWLK